MQLTAVELLEERTARLVKLRAEISATPTLALVWIGEDRQTALFVKAKQKAIKDLGGELQLHHFSKIDTRQLEALLQSLAGNKKVHGVVLQLPLPANLQTERMIALISPEKDVDGLIVGSVFPAPTPSGIIALLEANNVNPGKQKTVIIGAGKLVGAPLKRMFDERGWPVTLIIKDAAAQAELIRSHNILISCTGVSDLVTPAMVNSEMIVVDGSGVDVNVAAIEPLVRMITPKRGAVGPLTVSFLMENVLAAAKVGSVTASSRKTR